MKILYTLYIFISIVFRQEIHIKQYQDLLQEVTQQKEIDAKVQT
jgi:hypothetical protein